jgi:DnaK suppressor protein
MLTKTEIEHYKQALEAERSKLLPELKKKSTPEDFGSDTDHLDEEADETEEFVNDLSIAQSVRERIDEIDTALNRVETGTYGICVRCNREISKVVLDLIPESALCENCKRQEL